ncbi:hypothetical protein [Ligilactobacillus ceti]|uniref:TPR repeat-containing protein n=1 Tax=Ligilactobacillus ceti DSM 22408 TaxID=1122146 RepID=A0A0R2KHU2_9LACO|nr:hypothetical protein [Ligilactobacillus ceti]KRN88914.1 hypothetical protein IV53_GL000884 [Ligilactobacillus ceti DSM 22408]
MEKEISLKNAKIAFEQADYLKAKAQLEVLYGENQTFTVNYLLFQVLVQLNELTSAMQIANDYLKEYIADNNKLQAYFEVVVAAGQQIFAWQLLQNLKQYMNDGEIAFFKQILEKADMKYQTEHQREVNELKRQYRYLGVNELVVQRQLVKAAQALDYATYTTITSQLLKDDNINAFIRVNLLDELRKLDYAREVEFVDAFLNCHLLVPSELAELEKMASYQVMQNSLLADTNLTDNQKMLFWKDLTLKMILLYPTNEQFLSSESNWYEILLNDKTCEMSSKETKMRDILEAEVQKWQV